MDPAAIDWKNDDSRYVSDELYEHINAPRWADLTAADDDAAAAVDDVAWFCRPDCRHSKNAAADGVSPSTPRSKVLKNSFSFGKEPQFGGSNTTPVLGERNSNLRDANLKRRAAMAAARKPNSNKHREVDMENRDPNISPHKSAVAAVAPAILKEAVKSSAVKKVVGGEDNPPPRAATLPVKNLFAGKKDILSQISEFCHEIKKLVSTKERSLPPPPRPRAAGLAKEDGQGEAAAMTTTKTTVEKFKAQARSCPPTPQRFTPPSHRWRSVKAAATGATAASPSAPERGILKELVEKRLGEEEDKQPLLPPLPPEEGNSMDIFWLFKPCTYLAASR